MTQQLAASLGAAYALERELGGGGMSRVFLAEEMRFKRRVVIKVLSPELAAGLSAERFDREIGLAAGLQQANIVPVITAGEVDGLPWYSMPFVEGESVRARLQRGTVPTSEAIPILRDIARALAYAHQRGIVHRDIKPENVLLSGGAAMVTDFGIAKAISASATKVPDGGLTRVGTSLGTPAYMAPEQAAGDEVDQRADNYAWGVIAYEMLTGAHPFAGKSTAQQFIAAHIAEMPAPFGTVRPGVHDTLAALVMRCLAKDPALRPVSGGELLGALDTLPTGDTPRPDRRGWSAMRIAAIVTALVVAGATVVALRLRRGAPEASPSIAVLPFESRGPAEQAIFADGLSDAVTGKLVGIAGLTVIDRRSAATYRGTTKPAAQIGTELGVAYLLEGVVAWAKDSAGKWRAQVRPTLIRTRDGIAQWSGEPVIVTPNDPFTAQAEIAARVVEAIGVAIGSRERASLAAAPTKSAEAYELYLRAQVLARDLSPAAVRMTNAETIRLLERATQLDPSFALAFAELASAELTRESTGDPSATRDYQTAMSAALTLDPELPEAHFVRAQHLWFSESRFAEGLVEATRASSRKPGNAQMLSILGTFQIVTGQTSEGFANLERTSELDPRNPTSNNDAALFSWWFRRLDAAERHARRMVAITPDGALGRRYLIQIAFARGDTAAARRAMADAVSALGAAKANTSSVLWSMPLSLTTGQSGSGALPLAGMIVGSDSVRHYEVLGAWARETGQHARARAYFDTAAAATARPEYALSGHSIRLSSVAATQAIAFAGAGRIADAKRVMRFADSVDRENTLPNEPTMASAHQFMAYAHLLLGERDAAIAELERTLALPSGITAVMLRNMWPFASLHGDQRFQRLIDEHP